MSTGKLVVGLIIACAPNVVSAQLVAGIGTPLVPDPLPSTAPDQLAYDHFGRSVDLYGDTLVVGAPEHDGGMVLAGMGTPPPDLDFDSGAVYVFTRDISGVWTQQAKLTSPLLATTPARARREGFGSSVALWDDRLAIGAEGNTFPAPAAVHPPQNLNELAAVGGVYIFVRSGTTWTQQGAMLRGAEVDNLDHFGGSVDLEGNKLVVGARFGEVPPPGPAPAPIQLGNAYVFEFESQTSTWAQTAFLSPSSLADFDLFGTSVSVSGNRIVVGAPGTDGTSFNVIPDAGAAYVFDRVGPVWTQTAVLSASLATPQDYFGTSVSVDSGSIAIGAPLAETGSIINGNVTLFSFDAAMSIWNEDETLTICDPLENAEDADRFGSAVSLRGDRLLIGAWADATGGLTSGSAYFYSRPSAGASWRQDSWLLHPSPVLLDRFGAAVALDGDPSATGDWLAVTAWKRDVANAVNAGEVYAFRLSDMSPTDLCNGDGGNQAGCTDCPCMNNAPSPTVGGCLNGASRSARLVAKGTGSILCHDLRFELIGANSGVVAVLQSARISTPNNPASPCFGLSSGIQSVSFDGLRCITDMMGTGDFLRHGSRGTNTNGDVVVTFDPIQMKDVGGWGPPASGPALGYATLNGWTPGETRFFTVVYREDPNLGCGRGLNTSQAVRVEFYP